MIKKQEWLELAQRCEKATGPDREMDGDIAAALALHPSWLPRFPERPWLWADFIAPDDWETWEAPCLTDTAHLGAIVALIERTLPGWSGCFDFGKPFPDGALEAQLIGPGLGDLIYGKASTPALAICAALLRALASKGDRDAE